MQIDFSRIQYFSMTYVFMNDDGDDVCEYEQTAKSPLVTADGSGIRFELTSTNPQDEEIFTVTLSQREQNQFFIQSDFFEQAEDAYPLTVEASDQDILFCLEGDEETMYLYGFLNDSA